MTATLGYLGALFRTNLRAGFARPGAAISQLVLMLINNLIFFIVWALYFDRFPDLRGWGKSDVALLYGVAAFGFGLSIAIAGGMRDLSRAIVEGSLDVHLGRPRHPLPSLLMSRSIPPASAMPPAPSCCGCGSAGAASQTCRCWCSCPSPAVSS